MYRVSESKNWDEISKNVQNLIQTNPNRVDLNVLEII